MEEWRAVEGFPDYEVSNEGRIRSLGFPFSQTYSKKGRVEKYKPGRVLLHSIDGRGYPSIGLSRYGKRHTHTVHRLVAKAFLPNPLGWSDVNHIDGDRENNLIGNLEWCSHEANMNHFRSLPSAYSRSQKNGKVGWGLVNWIRAVHVHKDPEWGNKALAEKFGIPSPTICNIVNYRLWVQPWMASPQGRRRGPSRNE